MSSKEPMRIQMCMNHFLAIFTRDYARPRVDDGMATISAASHNANPIYMGVHGQNVLLSFGTGQAFALDQKTLTYISGAVQQLSSIVLHKEFKVSDVILTLLM